MDLKPAGKVLKSGSDLLRHNSKILKFKTHAPVCVMFNPASKEESSTHSIFISIIIELRRSQTGNFPFYFSFPFCSKNLGKMHEITNKTTKHDALTHCHHFHNIVNQIS